MNNGLEIKVGIFVIAATIIIAVISIAFGQIDFGASRTYDVHFEVIDAAGISEDTDVFYKGVKVGRINDISLSTERIIVTVGIYERFQVPVAVSFSAKQAGFVGSKYVDLLPIAGEDASIFLESGKIYNGNQKVVSIDGVIAKVDSLSAEVITLVESLNKVFATDNTSNSLANSVQNIEVITDSLNRLIAANEKSINDIVQNIGRLSSSVDSVLSNNQNAINTSLTNIVELTESLKEISNGLQDTSSSNQNDIVETIRNINEISEKLNQSLQDINSITRDIDEGKGTLGLLINDNETKDEVKAVISAVKDMTASTNNWKLNAMFGADYMFDADLMRGYGQIRLYPNDNNFYMVGVSNTPQLDSANNINENYTVNQDLAFSLQYGHIFKKVAGVRVGIFDNNIGLAGDIYPLLNENLVLSAEAYNFASFNNGVEIYTRAFARWHFLSVLYLQAGVEDILNNTRRVFTLGAGVKFNNDL